MAVQYKDYYQVLGVAKNASQDDIRKAFRKLAREFHPDVAQDKKAAENKFKEINEAYEVLGDPEKRAKYDELGANWNQMGGRAQNWGQQRGATTGFSGFEGGVNGDSFSDFFDAFFRGEAQGVHGQAFPFGSAKHAKRPRHIDAEVQVTVEELLRGVRKRINVRHSGHAEPEKIDVNIPTHTIPGQKIRLAGKGEHGGDLLLKVVLTAHGDYEVEGSDLVRNVSVPAWKAVLGGDLQVATPDGVVRLKVPSGTQSGRRFRLAGRGLPTEGKRRGDFMVKVQVEVPVSLTLEQRAAWVRLQELENGTQ
jgi:curved DNA-binding protein